MRGVLLVIATMCGCDSILGIGDFRVASDANTGDANPGDVLDDADIDAPMVDAMITTAVSCKQLRMEGQTASGLYTVDHDNNPGTPNIAVSCDMDADGGGWMLVANYVHKGGTHPPVMPSPMTLPVIAGSTLGSDESSITASWRHAAPTMLAVLPFTEMRFYCRTNQHARIVDFKTSSANCLNYFKTGTGTCGTAINTNTVTLPGHTGHLPASANDGDASRGASAMTFYPFFSATDSWSMDGLWAGSPVRWECDNFLMTDGSHTIHRIWVR